MKELKNKFYEYEAKHAVGFSAFYAVVSIVLSVALYLAPRVGY